MKTRTKQLQFKAGFTLIELMISMTILSFIALGVYQTTAQSFVLRDSVEHDGDFYNSIRVGLDIIGRDICHMYSPHSDALPGNLGKSPAKNQPTQGVSAEIPLGDALAFWGAPINPAGVRPTRLQGESTKLTFIINSHMRLFRDTSESDFAKITYTLEDEKIKDPNPLYNPQGKVLVKHEDPGVFDDTERSENVVKYSLISNVKSIKFQYLEGEKDKLDDRWDTAGMDHKGVFPAVVQLTLEVFMPSKGIGSGPNENTFKIVQQFRPEFLQNEYQ